MSSDIARGIVERLRADEKRLDFIEKHGVSIEKHSHLWDKDEALWAIIPPNRRYSVLSSVVTVREALDKAINKVESYESNEPKRHTKNRRRA